MKPNDIAKLFRDFLDFIQTEGSNNADKDTLSLVLNYVEALNEDEFFKPHIERIRKKANLDPGRILREENSKAIEIVRAFNKFLKEYSVRPSRDHLTISKKLLAFMSVGLICIDCIPPERQVKSVDYETGVHPQPKPAVTPLTVTYPRFPVAQSGGVQSAPGENFKRGLLSDQQGSEGNYILTFAISAKATDLVKELVAQKRLTPENFVPLFKSREWIHYAPEDQWKRTCGGLFERRTQAPVEDDYDVCYVAIKMDAPDDRFEKNSNMMKLYDALSDLAQKRPELKLSDRHPKESYENKGFFRV